MTEQVFPANVAVCPNCQHAFSHNKVNGVALVAAAADIDARKRTYCRLMLNDLERMALSKELTFAMIKKIVLDNFNDYNRDVQTILGLGLEAE